MIFHIINENQFILVNIQKQKVEYFDDYHVSANIGVARLGKIENETPNTTRIELQFLACPNFHSNQSETLYIRCYFSSSLKYILRQT